MAGVDLIARVVATDVRDGDLAIDGDAEPLAARRRAVVDRPWLWLRQVHGSDVVVLGDDVPVDSLVGSSADGAVTGRLDVVLAAHAADCATVALVGRPPAAFEGVRAGRVPQGGGGRPRLEAGVPDPDVAAAHLRAASTGAVIGVVHAGWRGLEAGVLGAAVDAMRAAGAADVIAVLGPCIGVECYEFGEADLARVVERVGPAAAGRTSEGRPALDLRLGVRAALRALDVEVVASDQRCTACSTSTRASLDDGAWADGPGRDGAGSGPAGPSSATWSRTSVPVLHSHRARGDVGRQALVVWLERPSLGQRP